MHVGYHGGTEGGHITLGGRQREVLWKVWENVTALEGNERKFLLARNVAYLSPYYRYIEQCPAHKLKSEFFDAGSLCCLIHEDNHMQLNKPLTDSCNVNVP